MLVWRFGKKWIVAILLVVAAASLGLAQWGSLNRPVGTFLLLPTRGWELLIGALIAFYLFAQKEDDREATPAAQLLGVAGLLLIAYAVFAFDKNTPFPGFYALIPAVGTGLVILFASSQTFAGKLLGSTLLVALGLVSYSAYLWHNPLFVFARLQSVELPSPAVMTALACASFALAYFSWRFVEAPLRKIKRPAVPFRRFVAGALTLSVVFIGIGSLGYVSQGFENQYFASLSDQQKKIFRQSQIYNDNDAEDHNCRFQMGALSAAIFRRFDDCFAKYGPAIAVLGDSHSVNVYLALLASTDRPFIVQFSTECSLQADLLHLAPPGQCAWGRIPSYLKSNAAKMRQVMYTQAGYFLVRDENGGYGSREMFTRPSVPVFDINPDFILPVIDYLEGIAQEVDTTWFGPRIEPRKNSSQLLKLAYGCVKPDITINPNILETFTRLDNYIKSAIPKNGRLRYVSQIDAVKFDVSKDMYDCTASFWADGDHWSRAGEKRFGARIVGPLLGY